MVTGVTAQTANDTIEKYCYNDDPLNCALYGGLYQWNEAMQWSTTPGTQGICPPGWHIPTYAEFQTLSSSVGGDGNALKAIGQGTRWARAPTRADSPRCLRAIGAASPALCSVSAATPSFGVPRRRMQCTRSTCTWTSTVATSPSTGRRQCIRVQCALPQGLGHPGPPLRWISADGGSRDHFEPGIHESAGLP
jgi:hypothetical protein